jgi:Big-like domain-containing protein/purple acid phosphatase-like protein
MKFNHSLPVVLISLIWTAVILSAAPAVAQFPGGFIEKSYSLPTNRPAVLSQSQIDSFLPSTRGPFNFPSPYNTQGVRITIPADCGGNDCVDYVGYSYWRNTNNHVGSDTMYIFLTMDRNRGGAGPTLFSYNKVTDAVANVGPLFDASSRWSWANGNGWYFSHTQPTKLYVNYWGDTTLFRYDVLSHTFEQVFDVASRTDIFGSNRYIVQFHSSADDDVHSATLRDKATDADLGCFAYRESTNSFFYYPQFGYNYDECQIDKSGRWLLIKEKTGIDPTSDLDNRIIDLSTGQETDLLDRNGAGGHSDSGYGSMVAADNANPQPGAFRAWQFGPLSSGQLVYYTNSWNTWGPQHLSFANTRSDLPLNQQYVCGSGATPASQGPEANNVLCFRLDGTFDVLIVAPVMTDVNIAMSSGCDNYCMQPKGNLDITGQYFIWTSNTGRNRIDAFIAKVPAQVLTGTAPPSTTTTTLAISAVSTPVIASSAATVAWSTNETADSQVEFGTTTSYGSSTPVNSTMVTSHSQSLGGLAASTVYHYRVKSKDSAGNIATSPDFSFTTNSAADTTPPTISAVSASGVSDSGAVIAWTTNESSDSQVEYGITSAYGSATAVNGTMLTSHSQSLSGLAPSTLYHFRVKSKDAAGNLATSGDFTFTTSASSTTTATATVAITTPNGGATVKGKIKVAATASSTNGIAGVQFQVDGQNIGNEDTSAAYAVNWNTGTVTNGQHVLTAIARDRLGNQTVSSPVTVTVKGSRLTSASTSTTSLQNVGWTNGVNVLISGNSLQENCGGCGNSGALSSQKIGSGNGYVQFTASETTTQRSVGLGAANTDTSRDNISYAISLWDGLTSTGSHYVEIYESGIYQGSTSYSTGDVFRIAVENGAVKYYKNGVLFYTSTKAPSYPLYMDTALWSAGATIANAVISTSP